MIRSVFILSLCTTLLAQEVSFDVQPREIGINEQVQFKIVIEGADTGRMPTFQPNMVTGDFDLLSRSPSVQSSLSIVNGQSSSSKTYSYILQPKKKGKVAFPAQTLTYAGKTYKTPPIEINVGDESRKIRPGSRGRDPFDPFSRRTQRRGTAEVFGTVEVPKLEYFLGEPILLNVYVYITPSYYILGKEPGSIPDLKDFWVEDLLTEAEAPQIVNKDGKRYQRYTIHRRRLFANKPGDITIPSTNFVLAVHDRPSVSLFESATTVRRRSEPLTIKVKPLPKANKPKDFSGLVGRFKVNGEFDTQEIKVGETLNIQVTLSGRGNFNAVRELSLEGLDPSFEVFKGGLPTAEKKSGETVAKTWAFALVPKKEGDFEIPLPAVSFFDLASETYKVTESEPFTLKVLPGEGLGSGAVITDNAGNRTMMVEQNLNFIKLGDLDTHEQQAVPSHPANLLKVLSAFLLLGLLLYLSLFLKEQLAGKRAGNRASYALKNFRKALGRLKSHGENADAYYGGLSEAVLNYFGDKWEREGKGISLEMIRDHFERTAIEEKHYQSVVEIIEACDLARFTPSTSASRENLLNKARNVVEDIEGALK